MSVKKIKKEKNMLPLIPIILLAVAGLAVVVLAVLNYERIIDWFLKRKKLKESDKENIAFTLQEKLENGNFKTIEGIFNKRDNKVLEAEVTEAKEIDEKLAKLHNKEGELVIYA
jgi:hypothetical protein